MVYVKIVRGMYGFPETGKTGKTANDMLKNDWTKQAKYPTICSKILGQSKLLHKSIHTRSVETFVETHHLCAGRR